MNYILGAAVGEETRVLLTLFILLAAAKFTTSTLPSFLKV